MDLSDLMKMLMGQQSPPEDVIEKNWPQLGKLTAADNGKKRSLLTMVDEKRLEVAMYERKILAIKTQVSAEDDEWWVYVRKTYGLTPSGEYHIHDDGRIFAKPQEKK